MGNYPGTRRSTSGRSERSNPARGPGRSPNPNSDRPAPRRPPGTPQRPAIPGRPGYTPPGRPQRPHGAPERPALPRIPPGFRPRAGIRAPGLPGMFQAAWDLGQIIGKLIIPAASALGLWPPGQCNGAGTPSSNSTLNCGGQGLFAPVPNPPSAGAGTVHFWTFVEPFFSLEIWAYNGFRTYVGPDPIPPPWNPGWLPKPPAFAPYPGVPNANPHPVPWADPYAPALPNAPLPAPTPVPYPAVPYRTPARSPFGYDRGPAPGYRPSPGWGAEVSADPSRPNNPVRPRPLPRPEPRSAPRPVDREAKLNDTSGRFASGFARIAGGLSEVGDFVDALWGALPASARSPASRPMRPGYLPGDRPTTPKIRDLYDHWDEIDWRIALLNLAANEVEDRIVGRALGAARRADTQNLGWLGTRLNGAS